MKRTILLSLMVFVVMLQAYSSALDFFSEELDTPQAQERRPPAEEPISETPRRSIPPAPLPGSEPLTPSELENYRSRYLSALRAVQQRGFPKRLIYVYSMGHEDTASQEAIITVKKRDPSLNISAFVVIDCTRPDQLRALTRSPFHSVGIQVFLDCQNSVLASYGISQLPVLVIDDPGRRPVVLTGPRILEGLP
jgi:hypothetical protein